MTPELVTALVAVQRRAKGTGDRIPLTVRYDPTEKLHSEPFPHLFVRRIGTRNEVLSPSVARRFLVDVAASAGLRDAGEPIHFTPHDFRRLFTTEMVSTGLPLHIAATLLGHPNLDTTRGYTAVVPAPGQLFLGSGQLQPDRPEQVSRQLAHPVSVALGKSLAPHPTGPGSVAGRSQLRGGSRTTTPCGWCCLDCNLETSLRAMVEATTTPPISSGRALVSDRSAGVLGGGPAGQEAQRFDGRAVGFGGVGDDHQSVAGQFHGFAGDFEVADEGVVEAFGRGAMVFDVVACPPGAERVASGRQFADKVGQGLVVGVAACLGAECCDGVVGDGLPVEEELWRAVVQEEEPGDVQR
jgi:Phage integrase family